MRSILLNVHQDDGLESRLQVAADLARGFDGHVTCLNAVPYEPTVPGDIYGAAFAAMIPVMREAADSLRAKVTAHLEKEDIRWDYSDQVGSPYSCLLTEATLNDLVVVGAADPLAGGRAPSSIAGSLAIHSRTPIMVVPDETRRFDVAAPAVVAWNGSAEAANAVRAALPLLKGAAQVYLCCAAEQNSKREEEFSAVDIAQYLARHDIEAEIVEISVEGKGVATALADAARARGAGYLVMGAYGRSRFAETVLGGVTRQLLTEVPLPLLLSH